MFMNSSLLIFLWLVLFVFCLRNICLLLGHEDILLMFSLRCCMVLVFHLGLGFIST